MGRLKENQYLQQYLKPSHLAHSPVISLYDFVATSFCLFSTIRLPWYACWTFKPHLNHVSTM